MQCKCNEQFNQQMKEQNVAIDDHFALDLDANQVTTLTRVPVRRIDTSKRNKLPTVVAAFCPMCGKSTKMKKKKAKRKSPKKKAK